LHSETLTASLPPAGGDAWTFSTKAPNGFTRKSLFGRCVSPTTKTLAVERRAAREGAGGATLQARRRSDLATGDSLAATLEVRRIRS
jgi:hypothetical protein